MHMQFKWIQQFILSLKDHLEDGFLPIEKIRCGMERNKIEEDVVDNGKDGRLEITHMHSSLA